MASRSAGHVFRCRVGTARAREAVDVRRCAIRIDSGLLHFPPRARVICSPLRRTVAVMPLIVMCTTGSRYPCWWPACPSIAARERRVAGAQHQGAEARHAFQPSASGAFCPDMVLSCQPSDGLQTQHRGLSFARARRARRPLQVMARMRDHFLKLGHPVADQLLVGTVPSMLTMIPASRVVARRGRRAWPTIEESAECRFRAELRSVRCVSCPFRMIWTRWPATSSSQSASFMLG